MLIYHKLELAVSGAGRSLGCQFCNTLMIGALDSFLFLHYGLTGTRHLSSELKQQLILWYLLIEAGCFIGIKNAVALCGFVNIQ